MPDPIVPAPAPTNTPVNGSTPGGASFTRTPIAVAPAPTPATAPETAKSDPSSVKQDESAIISALAKANAELRTTRKANEAFSTQLADLNAKLASASEGSTKAAALEAEIADMLSKPNKYFAKYKAKGENKLAELLEGFATEDAPEDPRIAALEAKDRARDEAAAKEKEDREKAAAEEGTKTQNQVNAQINGQIAAFFTSDANKEDGDGIQRWALTSLDDSAPNRARLEVLDYATKEGILNSLTREQRDDLLCQALDQMESESRKEALAKAERLKLAKQTKLTNDGRSYNLRPETQYDRRSQNQAPAIDANNRASLTTSVAREYRHGFTKE